MSDRFDSELELQRLYEASAQHYVGAIQNMVVAVALGDSRALEQAREDLDDVIGATMGAAEAVGALHTLQKAAVAYREAGLDPSPQEATTGLAMPRLSVVFARPGVMGTVPRVQFTEVLAELVGRVPVTLKRAAERTAQAIAGLYAKGRVMAFVRAAEQAVTERVKKLLVQSVEQGLVEREAGVLLKMGAKEVAKKTADWSEAYGRMVFRTNLNTATSAGRFRQVQDPDVRGVIPALQFSAVGDGDCRDNHKAADGIVMRQENPDWNRIAPPLGYNCRCTLQFLSAFTLRRMGRLNSDGSIREDRIPSNAHPDPGFRHGGRPDLFIKGAT